MGAIREAASFAAACVHRLLPEPCGIFQPLVASHHKHDVVRPLFGHEVG